MGLHYRTRARGGADSATVRARVRRSGRIAVLLAVTALGACSHKASAASDGDRARRLVLVDGDLPEGFLSKEHTTDTPTKQGESALAACLHIPDPARGRTAEFVGRDFNRGTGLGAQAVSSEAIYVRRKADLDRAMRVSHGNAFKDCVRTASQSVFTARSPTAHIDGITVADQPFPRYGSATAGYRVTTTFSAGGQTAVIYTDVVTYAKGRARVTATFTTVSTPFPASQELEVAAELGKRLEQRA